MYIIKCPPNKNISQAQFLSFFQSLGPQFLCGGNYNAKDQTFRCRASNSPGRTLLNALSSIHHQIITPGTPTYWPTSPRKRPDLLDFFISSNLYPLSNHSPVLLILNTEPTPIPPKPSLISGPMNWDGFRIDLEGSLDLKISLKNPSEIEEAVVHRFIEAIQRATWENLPSIPFTIQI
jgi:hypothetical protein